MCGYVRRRDFYYSRELDLVVIRKKITKIKVRSSHECRSLAFDIPLAVYLDRIGIFFSELHNIQNILFCFQTGLKKKSRKVYVIEVFN